MLFDNFSGKRNLFNKQNSKRAGFLTFSQLFSVYLYVIDKAILKKQFGISYLRPWQELVITRILELRDEGGKVLCILPTGSGKSLCFMYPIAVLERHSILVYPLLSLMNDQAKRLEKASIPFVLMKGGMTRDERNACFKRISEEKRIAIVTNPETLLAMEKRGELKLLSHPALLVIDEAHTAVTWGENFRPSYLELGRLVELLRADSTLAFTATADESITEGIIKHIFSGRIPYTVRDSSDRENIFYHSLKSLSKQKDIQKILAPPSSRPAVIFCRSRKETEYLAGLLNSGCYHAGLTSEERKERERWFLSSSDGVLVSTSAYGMGVDKKNIRTVIHTHLPESVPDFLQESGRGGRDGGRMDSWILWYDEECSPIKDIFTNGKCIRHSLLLHMGEENAEECLGCSACVHDGYRRAGEDEIMAWVKWHPGHTIKGAAKSITTPAFFSRWKNMKGWNGRETEMAIKTLVEEKHLHLFLSRLFCPLSSFMIESGKRSF